MIRQLRPTLLVAVALLLLAAVPPAPPARAAYFEQPDALPGWTHQNNYGIGIDTDQRHGINLGNAPIVRSSPVIGEIDGDADNFNEVAVVGNDGRLYARRANGSQLWPPVQLLPSSCSSAEVGNSSPAVGELLGNGVPYVVVGYGSVLPSTCDGGIVAVNGQTGQIAWRFSLRAWQAQQGYPPEDLYGVIGSVALADTDGDGRMEIAFGGLDRNLYLLSATGPTSAAVRWYYHVADTVWSTPVFANVDSDPELELVAATDISANPLVIPPTQDGGFIHAFDTAARSPVRIEFQTGFIWRTFVDQGVYSSPAVGDVLASNSGLEVVVGASCYFPAPGTPKRGRWVKIFSLSSGALLQTLNAPECVGSSPALGDIDGDGELEIVVNVGSSDDNGITVSETVAWDPTIQAPKWRTQLFASNDGTVNDPNGGDLQSPVIADIDGNGTLEVITANFWDVIILRGHNGQQLTCRAPCGSTRSLFAWYTVKATPAVGDVNGDGVLDVVMGGGHNFAIGGITAHLYAWTNLDAAFDTPPPGGYQLQAAYAAPWPQFRRTADHNAVLRPRALLAGAGAISVLTDGSAPLVFPIGLTSADGTAISVSRAETGDSAGIVSSTVSSPVSGASPGTLTVTIDAAGKAAGTYTITLRLTSSGLPDVVVTVTVQVVDSVEQSFLPLAQR